MSVQAVLQAQHYAHGQHYTHGQHYAQVQHYAKSHIVRGKIGLPRTVFSLVAGFGVKNEGDGPGLLAVKMRLTKQKTLAKDPTWYRFTPLVNDSFAKGPNIVTDKLYEFTKGRFRGYMVAPPRPDYPSLLLNPGIQTIVVAGLVIPGADTDPEVKKFWDTQAAGADFNVEAELWMVDNNHVGIKQLADHTYTGAFGFTSQYVSTPQMRVIGQGVMAATSS